MPVRLSSSIYLRVFRDVGADDGTNDNGLPESHPLNLDDVPKTIGVAVSKFA